MTCFLLDPVTGARITKRDTEMLDLWSRGHENEDVAKALNISRETVKSGARRIYEKLGASGRTEACCIAMSRGFIKLRSDQS